MINHAVVERHAELAIKLWIRRQNAARAGNYKLADLGRLDARIDAHLEGLLLAGQGALDICLGLLDPEVPETCAVFAYLAQRLHDSAARDRLLAIALSVPEVYAGCVEGLSFVPPSELSPELPSWLTSQDRGLQALGIEVATRHRLDPGDALGGDWPFDQPAWLVIAANAVASVGLAKWLPWLYQLLDHAEPAVRFAGAVAVRRLRGAMRERALAVIDEVAADAAAPRFAFALALSLRLREGAAYERYAQRRAELAAAARHVAAGAVGTVAVIDQLVSDCQDPKLSRTAANAFALITGFDLEFEDLEGKPPPRKPAEPGPVDDDALVGEDGLPNLPPYSAEEEDEASEGLLWPDGEKLRALWQSRRARFTPDLRYLGGKLVGVEGARHVLQHGSQRARFEAAWELALRESGPLFNTTAPRRQQAIS